MVEQAAGNYGKAAALRTHARERRLVQDRARNTIAKKKESSANLAADTNLTALWQAS